MVTYIDLYGSSEDVLFSPDVRFSGDEIVVEPCTMVVRGKSYAMPRHVLKTGELWCDYLAGVYRTSEIDASPGTLYFLRVVNDGIMVYRFVEKEREIVQMIAEKIGQPKGNWFFRWLRRRLNEV